MAEAPPSEAARPKRPYTMSHTAMAVRPPTKSTKNTQQPSIRPSFRCRPERVRGMPVRRDSRALAAEIPRARFQENDKPYLRRRAIGRLSWLGWSYRFVDFGLRQQALKKSVPFNGSPQGRRRATGETSRAGVSRTQRRRPEMSCRPRRPRRSITPLARTPQSPAAFRAGRG